MSVFARLLMMRKIFETWVLWIAVDLLSIGIYFAKGIYLTVALYSVFLVLAIVGFRAWRKTPEAEDIRVDMERGRFPVSGTRVRSSPFRYREYIHPIVYRDLVEKIVFLGAETRYDRVFVCGDEIPYDEDGTRSGDEHRHRFQQEILADLAQRKVPCKILRGGIEERVAAVREELTRPRSPAPS